jgi:hypothetical protein
VNQRTWADQYLPWQLEILNKHVQGVGQFVIANDIQDMQQNTDAISTEGIRACLRMRSWERARKYMNQFTIRGKNGGHVTEFDKIGWPDYMLYGIARYESTEGMQWFIGDMAVLRPYVDKNRESLRSRIIYNTDNRTGLIPFDIDEIPSVEGKLWVVADSGTGFFRDYRPDSREAWYECGQPAMNLDKRIARNLPRVRTAPGHIHHLQQHDCTCGPIRITETTPSRASWVVCERCKRWRPPNSG